MIAKWTNIPTQSTTNLYQQSTIIDSKHSINTSNTTGTLCLHLLKVSPPSPHSRHIWKQNHSLLHTTQSNISSAAGASDSNSWHTVPPIDVFNIWHLQWVRNLVQWIFNRVQWLCECAVSDVCIQEMREYPRWRPRRVQPLRTVPAE